MEQLAPGLEPMGVKEEATAGPQQMELDEPPNPTSTMAAAQTAEQRDQTHTASTSQELEIKPGPYTQREQYLINQEQEGEISFK